MEAFAILVQEDAYTPVSLTAEQSSSSQSVPVSESSWSSSNRVGCAGEQNHSSSFARGDKCVPCRDGQSAQLAAGMSIPWGDGVVHEVEPKRDVRRCRGAAELGETKIATINHHLGAKAWLVIAYWYCVRGVGGNLFRIPLCHRPGTRSPHCPKPA